MALRKELSEANNKPKMLEAELARLQGELRKKEGIIQELQVKEEEWDVMKSKQAEEVQGLILSNYNLSQNVRLLQREKDDLSRTVEDLELKVARQGLIPSLRSTESQTEDTPSSATSSSATKPAVPKQPPRPTDVIFFHDSLGKSINKTICSREGLTTRKIRKARLHLVKQEIEDLPATSAPRLFVIHVGTNDLHTDTCDDVLDKYISLVAALRTKFPQSKVIISHLITRTDNESLQLMIDYINASLSIEFAEDANIKVCKHLNIGPEFLVKNDGVHLNNPGTSKLSTNLRYAIANSLKVKIVP